VQLRWLPEPGGWPGCQPCLYVRVRKGVSAEGEMPSVELLSAAADTADAGMLRRLHRVPGFRDVSRCREATYAPNGARRCSTGKVW